MAVDSFPRVRPQRSETTDDFDRIERERMIDDLIDAGYVARHNDGTLALGSSADTKKVKTLDGEGGVSFTGKGRYMLGQELSERIHPEIVGKYSAIQLTPLMGALLEVRKDADLIVSSFFNLLSDEEYDTKRQEFKRRQDVGETAKKHMSIVTSGVTLLPADPDLPPIVQDQLRRKDFQDAESFQHEYAMRFLEKKGYMTHVMTSQGPRTVWDIEKFLERTLSNDLRDTSDPSKRITLPNIVRILRNEQGVSKSEYEKKGEAAQVKNLFYYPDSRDQAFHPASIQKGFKESHLTLFDLSRIMSDYSVRIPLKQSGDIALDELYLTTEIFGKMKAQRTGDGTLMIHDAVTNAPQKFSATQFMKESKKFAGRTSRRDGAKFSFHIRPLEYIQTYCPELFTRPGLLRVEDFGMNPNKSGATFRKEHPVDHTGTVMLRGAKYSLGAAFGSRGSRISAKQNWSVLELTPELAGVLKKMEDGTMRLEKIFRLKSKKALDERRDRVRSKNIGRSLSEAEVTGRTSFTVREIEWEDDQTLLGTKPFSGETHEHFAARAKRTPDFNFVRDVTSSLSVGAGIGIHTSLTLREQLWLATAANEIPGGKERITSMTKMYGVPFLKTFLSCEYGIEKGVTVLTLAETPTISNEIKQSLFHSYASLSDSAESVAVFLRENYGDRYSEEVAHMTAEHLLSRGKDLITHSENELKKKGGDQRILQELARLDSNALVLRKTFFETKKRHPDLTFDIQAFHFTCMTPEDISSYPEYVDQMVAIYKKNCEMAGYSRDYTEELLSAFIRRAHETTNSSSVSFYILFDAASKKVLAFSCFSDVNPSTREFSAFNVSHDWNGSKLGETMMEQTVDMEAVAKRIVATTNPAKPITQTYIEKHGFVVVGLVKKKDGTVLFQIERDPSRSTYDAKQNKTQEDIVREARYFRADTNEGIEAQQENSDQLIFGVDEHSLTPEGQNELYSPLEQGYVLARYFKQGSISYLVFEKAGFKRSRKKAA